MKEIQEEGKATKPSYVTAFSFNLTPIITAPLPHKQRKTGPRKEKQKEKSVTVL